MPEDKPKRAIVSQPAAVSLVFSAIELFQIPGLGDSYESYGYIFGHRDFNAEVDTLYIDHALPLVYVADRTRRSVAPYHDFEQLRGRLWTLQHPILHSTLYGSRMIGSYHSHPVSGQAALSDADRDAIRPNNIGAVVGVSRPTEGGEEPHWRLENNVLKGRLDVVDIQIGIWYREGQEIVQYQPICQSLLGADAYWDIE